jgi:hypothetical protein
MATRILIVGACPPPIRPGLDGTTIVDDADVATYEAMGWEARTVQMTAPSETSEASVGARRYMVDPDGTAMVAPADVPGMVRNGFKIIGDEA